MNLNYSSAYGTYSNYNSCSTNGYAFPYSQPQLQLQPIAPPIRQCDYCGTKYYEKLEENKALVCPSCGGPR